MNLKTEKIKFFYLNLKMKFFFINDNDAESALDWVEVIFIWEVFLFLGAKSFPINDFIYR